MKVTTLPPRHFLSLLVPIAIGCAAAVAATTVAAQTPYMGAEVQYTVVKDRAQENANALVNALGGSASVTQDRVAYAGRLFGGWEISENFALELGYTQTNDFGSKFNGRSSGGVSYDGSLETSVSGFDYSILLRPTKASGLNGLFFRVGGHRLTMQDTGTISAGVSYTVTEKTTGSGYQYGIGYDGEAMQNWNYRVSATHVDKVAGISGAHANFFGFGLLKKF